jgi:hypothetical protein
VVFVMSDSTPVMVGAVVSRTVTSKLPVASLPAASVAEQFTCVMPIGKVFPEAGEQSRGTLPSTSSVAVALEFTCAPLGPVASSVTSLRLSVGGMVSGAQGRHRGVRQRAMLS